MQIISVYIITCKWNNSVKQENHCIPSDETTTETAL